jgi:hypothetical protein
VDTLSTPTAPTTAGERTQTPSPGQRAAQLILESPSIAARTRPHVHAGEVDWASLLAEAETMSGGEAVLVRVAYDLAEARGVVGIWEIPRRLGPANFARVLEAIRLAHVWGQTEVVETAA